MPGNSKNHVDPDLTGNGSIGDTLPGAVPDNRFANPSLKEFGGEEPHDSADDNDEGRETERALRKNSSPETYDMSGFVREVMPVGDASSSLSDGDEPGRTPTDHDLGLNRSGRGLETTYRFPQPENPSAPNGIRDGSETVRGDARIDEFARQPDPIGSPPLQELTTIWGTEGDDVLLATNGNFPGNWSKTVEADGGDDIVIRDQTGDGIHEVFIYGGSGDDTVSYASANAAVFVSLATSLAVLSGSDNIDELIGIEGANGTAFDDFLFGSSGANRLYGNGGNDTIEGIGGNDRLWGHAGEDSINGGSGNDLIQGGDDDDDLDGGSGSDTVYGGDGDDDITGGSNDDTLYGDDGNDTIVGGHGDDVIHDGNGNDVVSGNGGGDVFYIGDGNDTFSGGSGNDRFYVDGFGDNVIQGGNHNDTVIFGNAAVVVNLAIDWAQRGAEGTDTITGVENIMTGNGADLLAGTSFDNFIHSGGGNDVASGLEGDDTINGGSGHDSLSGDGGDDDLIGGSGDDVMWGKQGVDQLDGNSGDDTLYGGDDSDQISGGSGEDRIGGGAGEDWMTGGADADTFVWNAGDVDVPQIDQILDFDVNEDMFSFGAGFFDAGPGPFNLSSVLVAAPHGGGDSVLWADTNSVAGWQVIARLDDVSAGDLNQRIQNGTILDVETGFEGPGGFELGPLNQGMAEFELPVIDVVTEWDFIL